MKCVACELENPAARELCYRCSHPLDFSNLILDPPRQTKWSKWVFKAAPPGRSAAYRRMIRRLPHLPFMVWAVSVIPGLGHALLGRPRWALGLLSAWLVVSIQETGAPTLRPGTWVMMVQCFAMADAYLKARDTTSHWAFGLLINLLTAAFLALTEMYLIGGILA